MLCFEAPHQEGSLSSPSKCILLPPWPLSAAFLCPFPWEVEGLESITQAIIREDGPGRGAQISTASSLSSQLGRKP